MFDRIHHAPAFRPPAEADSLILQLAEGCPWNRCTFCGMYKRIPFRQRPLEEVFLLIDQTARRQPDTRRLFLADGDPLRRVYSETRVVLQKLNQAFPRLARINAYATGTTLMACTESEWRDMHALKLQTLYMGLESGDPATLKQSNKQESVEIMVEGACRAQAAGLRLSVMILLGLGGQARSRIHIEQTAEALNRMQPRLLSCLRAIPVPGTAFDEALRSGQIQAVSEYGVVDEMLQLLSRLALKQTVFRANHSSNVAPLEGRLPKDQPALIALLRQLLASGQLDRHSPGPMPLWL